MYQYVMYTVLLMYDTLITYYFLYCCVFTVKLPTPKPDESWVVIVACVIVALLLIPIIVLAILSQRSQRRRYE
jgi:hypothetical protein